MTLPSILELRRDPTRAALILLALLYALLAGLRLVSETDLGWQMATGRYILEHHTFPSTALFTYTVPNAAWIYPVGSEILFYLCFLVGGYAALSWLGALACAGTMALTNWRGSRATAALSILAVPEIAFRTMPRADLFTTVLFAATLALLWAYYWGKAVRLWLLPLLMLCWANLHEGFIAGFGLLAAYVCFEVCDLAFAERRKASLGRLQTAAPWLVASFAAPLANASQAGSVYIGEWSAVRWNALALRQAVNPLEPESAKWWLLAVAICCAFVCIRKRTLGPGVLLAAASYEAFHHLRFLALFAMIVVVFGGALLPELPNCFSGGTQPVSGAEKQVPSVARTLSPAWRGLALVAVCTTLVAVRSYGLVSQRYYIDAGETTLFGAGESSWFPERAAEFLERQHLPANVFHDYNLGGFLAWRIGEQYPVFADGRFVPFIGPIFDTQSELLAASPDTPAWRAAADRWNINSILLSLSRYGGLTGYSLDAYCNSAAWRPVYWDDISILFVRAIPQNAELVRRLGSDCRNLRLAESPAAQGSSWRARAERFTFLMNSASVYFVLARDADAFAAIAQAAALFPENANLHLVKAQLLAANNRVPEAEQEFLRAIRSRPSDAAWFSLALLYNSQKRYEEAKKCIQESLQYSTTPFERWRSLGLLYVSMGQLQNAMTAFDHAERDSPLPAGTPAGREFAARMATARARAYRMANDLPHAIQELEKASQLTPNNSAVWSALAQLYEAAGDTSQAAAAKAKAESLQPDTPPAQPTVR